MRYIVKYKNRKLYDKEKSGYVKLEDLQQMITDGKPFRVVKYNTNEDITYDTLVNVLSNKLRSSQKNLENLMSMINY